MRRLVGLVIVGSAICIPWFIGADILIDGFSPVGKMAFVLVKLAFAITVVYGLQAITDHSHDGEADGG